MSEPRENSPGKEPAGIENELEVKRLLELQSQSQHYLEILSFDNGEDLLHQHQYVITRKYPAHVLNYQIVNV